VTALKLLLIKVACIFLIILMFGLTRIHISDSALDAMPGLDPGTIQWVRVVPLSK